MAWASDRGWNLSRPRREHTTHPGGCELSRDIPALIREAGFEIIELEEKYLSGPTFARPWMHGYRSLAMVSQCACPSTFTIQDIPTLESDIASAEQIA